MTDAGHWGNIWIYPTADKGKYFILCRLKPLDVEFMKRLHDKVNIIPMVAKADTLTPDECREFKKTVSTVSAFTNYGDKGFYRITNLSNHTQKKLNTAFAFTFTHCIFLKIELNVVNFFF